MSLPKIGAKTIIEFDKLKNPDTGTEPIDAGALEALERTDSILHEYISMRLDNALRSGNKYEEGVANGMLLMVTLFLMQVEADQSK